MTTVLDLVNEAADDLKFGRIDSMFAAYDEGDTTDKTFRRALTKTLKYLSAAYDWQCLKRERLFTWSANEEEVAASVWRPSNFLRFTPGTMHDRTISRPIAGPVTAKEWQDTKLVGVASPSGIFRVANNYLVVTPKPYQHQIAFEYIANTIALSSGGTEQPEVLVDTDTTPFDDELVIAGICFHHRRNERLDYAVEWADFMSLYRSRVEMDGHRAVIDFGRGRVDPVDALKNAVNVRIVGPLAGDGYTVP